MKKKSIIISTSIIVYITLCITTIVVLSKTTLLEYLIALMPQEQISVKNILVYGIDNTKKTKRADSIMLFHINSDQNYIGVLSIPRDTSIHLPKIGLTKINHTYAYKGVNLLKDSISDLIGLPIDNYIEINIKQVKRIIDQIGGVPIHVKNDLYYKDLAGGININIKKGNQILNGTESVNYLRFRKDKKGDIGRIERQQHFLQNLSKKILSTTQIIKLPSLLKSLNTMTTTDLKTTEMISLANSFIDAINTNNLKKTVIPGSIIKIDNISYWKPNENKLENRIENILLGFKTETTNKHTLNQNHMVETATSKPSTKQEAAIRQIEEINEELHTITKEEIEEEMNQYELSEKELEQEQKLRELAEIEIDKELKHQELAEKERETE